MGDHPHKWPRGRHIVNALYDYMTGAKTADEVSEIGISCENTQLVFAAERSRLNGDVETITPLE